MSLLRARLRGRGNLIRAMEDAEATYGVDTRTLERWIRRPTRVLTGPGEYEFALFCQFFKEIRAAVLEATGCDLAHLSPSQYDRVRQAEAEAMGVPVTTLDAEVAGARTTLTER